MSEQVQRDVVLPAAPEDVWDAITASGWLAEEVELDLKPGGDATFRSGEEQKTGWIEEVSAPFRLAFWWAFDGEPATRVELTLTADQDVTRIQVVESRPLDLLDLVGTPLPRTSGRTFGPALVAA
jgi:uncharacterized protein YndB with AHSA1/START domain